MPKNNDQGQFLMFAGIGAGGMSAIVALVYFIAFSGGSGSSEPAPAPVAAAAPAGSVNRDVTPATTSTNDTAQIENPFTRAQAAGDLARYKNSIKQILLAAHNYHDTHGSFPVSRDAFARNKGLSWRVHLLPFLDQEALYRQFSLDEPWDGPTNKPLLETMPSAFQTPGAPPNHTGIVRFDGPGAFPPGESVTLNSITDGTSITIFCTMVNAEAAVPWTQPVDYVYDTSQPAAKLLDINGTFAFGLCDGSVITLSANMDLETLKNMITRGDGKVVSY